MQRNAKETAVGDIWAIHSATFSNFSNCICNIII